LPVRVGKTELRFENRTLVMGILNVTPDSFSDGGRYVSVQAAVDAACAMVECGADIVDVGGESTRPGAEPVSLHEELARVVPVVEALTGVGIPAISVDTRHAAVAAAALAAGAGMVNDVSALTHDARMGEVAARHGAAVVVMHMRGTDPRTMQQGEIVYGNVVEEVIHHLKGAVQRAVDAGVKRSQVLVDPGFGFGKTVQHNLDLTLGIGHLGAIGHAVVFGPSRKSTLGWLGGGVAPLDRGPATLAACVLGVMHGAHVVRVHDVSAVRQALAVVDAARGAYMAPG
jgi:dihydropteroate synthase